MKNIKKILAGIYDNPVLRSSIVPLFLGNPGLGKTKMIEQFAKERNVNLVEFITSQRNPFEISGMAMPDRDTKKMAYWDFDIMLDMKDGDILFFDELLNGNPVVLNACLTILEQRKMISGKKLPNIMIIAAANPQGVVPLTPQIKERFIWYETKFSRELWIPYMQDTYGITIAMADQLSTLIEKEDFKTKSNNFYTPRSIVKAINLELYELPNPYNDVMHNILSAFITNTMDEDIKLSEGLTLAPGEKITWLSLQKHKIKLNQHEIIREQEANAA